MGSTLVSGVIAALALAEVANPATASTIDQRQLLFDATTGF
jgi:predicted exporter